jgi:hypothetical protein
MPRRYYVYYTNQKQLEWSRARQRFTAI